LQIGAEKGGGRFTLSVDSKLPHQIKDISPVAAKRPVPVQNSRQSRMTFYEFIKACSA
jgi:hypothetical protein